MSDLPAPPRRRPTREERVVGPPPEDEQTPIGSLEEEEARGPGLGVLVVVVLVAAAAVVGGALVVIQQRRNGPAVQLVHAGQLALSDGHEDTAITAFQTALDRGADPAVVRPLLKQAQHRHDERAAIARARAALQERRFDDARVALQDVDRDGPFGGEAEALVKQIEPARGQALFEVAELALRKGDRDRAREMLNDIAALRPDLATTLKRELAQSDAEEGPPPADSTFPPLDLGTERVGPEAAVRRALASAFAPFDRGDLARAAQEFTRHGEGHADGSIRAAARSLALATRSCSAAVDAAASAGSEAWRVAVRTCTDVDPGSPEITRLRGRLADSLDREAEAALKAGNPLAALRAYHWAGQARPGDKPAEAALQKLAGQAHQLASQARTEPNPAKAKELWQAVAALLPPGDPDADAAQHALRKAP